MKIFCINIGKYALLFECETWPQAEEACKELNAELLGELVYSEEVDDVILSTKILN